MKGRNWFGSNLPPKTGGASSSKKTPKTARKAPRVALSGGSSGAGGISSLFQPCVVCGRGILAQHLQAHIEECLEQRSPVGEPAPPPFPPLPGLPSSGQGVKRKRGSDSRSSTGGAASSQSLPEASLSAEAADILVDLSQADEGHSCDEAAERADASSARDTASREEDNEACAASGPEEAAVYGVVCGHDGGDDVVQGSMRKAEEEAAKQQQECVTRSGEPRVAAAAAAPDEAALRPSRAQHAAREMPMRNAYDELRKGAAKQFRTEIFVLSRTSTGRLTWSWDGAQRPSHPSPTSAARTPAEVSQSQSDSDASVLRAVAWEAEVQLPGCKHGKLILRTNIPCEMRTPPQLPHTGLSLSVLKSALQKSVRRSQGSAAVRIALSLMREAPQELLRRALVIMFEDATLHPPALVVYTWLMMATSKGFTMDAALRAAVLRMVHEIACSKHKDWCTRPYVDGLESVGQDVFSPETVARDMHPEAAVLVRCILARKHYGGMSFDMMMLSNLAKLWSLRLRTTPLSFSSSEPLMQLLRPPDPETRTTSTNPPVHNMKQASADVSPTQATKLGIASARTPLSYVCADKLAWYTLCSNPWLRFLISSITVSTPLSSESLLGRSAPESHTDLHLRPHEDVPLAAIDFHCSDIIHEVEKKLHDVERQALTQTVSGSRYLTASSAGVVDVTDTLKSVIWHCSSSVTNKGLITSCGGVAKDGGVDDEKERLGRAWDLISSHVLACAKMYIRSRTGAPRGDSNRVARPHDIQMFL